VNPTNAAGLAGNWSVGTITPSIPANFATPLNTEKTFPGGAIDSTITVTVIGGGGGGGGGANAASGYGGNGGNGGVATYTFTGVALGTTIKYYVGNRGGGGSGGFFTNANGGSGSGGTYSYVTVGSTTIYAYGGGGGGGGGGDGSDGTISTNPAATNGNRIGAYGLGGGGGAPHVGILGAGGGGDGTSGIISITMGNYGYTITQTPANPTVAPTITITPVSVGTTYGVPVNFSYNSGELTSSGSTSIAVTAVTGYISATTLAYASGTPPNGINSSFTASFTPNATSNLIVLYDTPEAGLYDARYNAQTQTLTSGLTTTFNNGGLNTNIVYRIGAAQSINGNRGNVFQRNIVYPGAVTNLVWGSASGSSDKSLANENTFWISWTPITFDPAVSVDVRNRFTYTLYSGTTPPSAPSPTAPTGATAYAGYAYTQSSIQVGIASIGTSGTFFIVTRYADPGGYSYYSAASAVVKFTYGSVSYTSGNQRFLVVGANTYANISVVGAGGGSANAGNGGGSSSGGGGGGYINYYGYRGIQYYDQIFVTAGGGGANGGTVSLYTGGQGGSANGVAGNAGNTNSANGVNNNPPNGGGRGGGGGARFFGVTTTSSC
jgi:hypothetical protein